VNPICRRDAAHKNVVADREPAGAIDKEAEPEPVISTSVYWLVAVARRTVPLVALPEPRNTTPLAEMVIVFESGYTPGLSSTAPRKPLASRGRVET